VCIVADETVVLITGASSGIGRATALAFARRRARLVLAARNLEPLEAAAQECRGSGASALVVSADVTDLEAVSALRERAVAAYGRVDIWVNCAAVLLFGRFEDITPASVQRLIDTNVLGCFNGSRAALTQFKAQGDQGVLINMGSLLGVVGEPYVSAYVASKFAIRGFTACLRQEVRDRPGIMVCAVLPPAIDTPIYQKAGNLFGREVRSIMPVYAAQRVANLVVRTAERPRREVTVGAFGMLLRIASRLAPILLERLVGRFGPMLQFESGTRPPTDGNLFTSTGRYAADDGWRRYWLRKLVLPWSRRR
jgi:NAD(P)-dependent dehydrogenase (short-subunit alcohol dehydrogenase family)